MAVYVTGDKHQNYYDLFKFADKMELNENDYIIVLGDMGLFWRYDRTDALEFINYFEQTYNFNLYFLDGNHENFNILKTLPEDEQGMGFISQHIRHLKRGRRYNIQGRDILTIGGADSIDKFKRIGGLSWWEEERITDEDIKDIKEDNYTYVLSHTCPISIFNMYKNDLCTLGNIVDDDNPEFKVSNYKLQDVLMKITWEHWYFGHYHIDKDLDDSFTCLYHEFRELRL